MSESAIERVLVVDDDDVDREFTVRLLARTDPSIEVDEAESAEQAMRLIDSRAYDCILLDNHMPEVSGMEMLPEIKRRLHDRPMGVIMMSGLNDERVAKGAVKLGFHDYLTKGKLDPQEFVATLSGCVARARREFERGDLSDPV